MKELKPSDFRPVSDLMDMMSPQSQRRIRARATEILQEMHLAEIRKLLGKTQVAAGKSAKMTQAEISRLERNPESAQLKTLDRYVSGLGGKLQLVAVLPDGVQAAIPLRHGKLVKSRLKITRPDDQAVRDD